MKLNAYDSKLKATLLQMGQAIELKFLELTQSDDPIKTVIEKVVPALSSVKYLSSHDEKIKSIGESFVALTESFKPVMIGQHGERPSPEMNMLRMDIETMKAYVAQLGRQREDHRYISAPGGSSQMNHFGSPGDSPPPNQGLFDRLPLRERAPRLEGMDPYREQAPPLDRHRRPQLCTDTCILVSMQATMNPRTLDLVATHPWEVRRPGAHHGNPES